MASVKFGNRSSGTLPGNRQWTRTLPQIEKVKATSAIHGNGNYISAVEK